MFSMFSCAVSLNFDTILSKINTSNKKTGQHLIQYLNHQWIPKQLSCHSQKDQCLFQSFWDGNIIQWCYHPVFDHCIGVTIGHSVAMGFHWWWDNSRSHFRYICQSHPLINHWNPARFHKTSLTIWMILSDHIQSSKASGILTKIFSNLWSALCLLMDDWAPSA